MASKWLNFENSVECDICSIKAGRLFFDEYQLVKKIYQGMLSHIYIIKSKETQELYILKAIDKSQSRCDADLIKRINHPNIVKVYDVFETDKYVYIRKEYIRGVTLESFIRENSPLNEQEILEIALKLCKIIAYLHSMSSSPVIYRDLKPANIIVNENGELKLIDLDSVRQYKENADNDTVYIGTEGFASPEQFGYGQTDIRSDIYTLGATLYYLLTLQKPTTDKLKLNNFKEIRPDISSSLEKIIIKCIQFNPDSRYQNINQLQKDLMGICSDNILLRHIYRFRVTYPKKSALMLRGVFLMIIFICLLYLSGNMNIPFFNWIPEQSDMTDSSENRGSIPATEETGKYKLNIINYDEFVGAYEPVFDLGKLNLDNMAFLSLQLVKDGKIVPIQYNINDNKLILINNQPHVNLLDVDQEYNLYITSSDKKINRIVFRPMYQELKETEGLKIYYIPARPEKGVNFPYYLILPSEESIKRNKGKRNYLLVEPYYMGEYSDDLAKHTELAFENAKINSVSIAEELGLPRIIPIFVVPESQYWGRDIYAHVLNRNTILLDKIMEFWKDEANELFGKMRRIDLQLIGMIKDANHILESSGWTMEDRIFLWGKEEAGHFANRFTFLHPELVKAVICQGLPLLGISSYEGNILPYPFGTADYKDITGREFSQEEYNRVAKLGYIFTKDKMEPLYHDKIDFEVNSEDIYRLLQFEEYPGKWQLVSNLYIDSRMQLQVNLYEDDSLIEMDSISFFEANRESDISVYISSNNPEHAKTITFYEQQKNVTGSVNYEKTVAKATINEAFWSGTMPKTLSDDFIKFYTSGNSWHYDPKQFFISIQEWDSTRSHRQMEERVLLYGGDITLKAEGYKDLKAKITTGSMTYYNQGYIYFVELVNESDMVSGVRYRLVDDTGNWIINEGVTVERPNKLSQ